ncbi:hypothetical protein SARC_12264 [Sphaeroforma arctica JP610]|uniref:Polysaccharide lyase 14 domain-containing protein n=1 Tax=Sphaeroforma arctica JP610 TaxID=667725 RepID=A0A0L0FFG6_9EUKA|nr:hypothetical protein SARC_12264 [Sphaeroforma arctica JP610]KNC75206.1 hypothetical protein SARC_12264 [Sphaeroforma arctica JP610]|eukprot:XP_014149108.1 hypothetical protein SARC_12264 [Sphaeroforma arctica JP610]
MTTNKSVLISLAVAAQLLSFTIAAPSRRSNVALSVPNFNDYSEGDAPDIYKLFKAPFTGCFGMYRDSTDCVSSKPNDSYVKVNPTNKDERVMEINLRAGVYGTSQKGTGGQFYSSEFTDDFGGVDEATYEYQVYFPSGFEWTHGGKLPGQYIGSMDCSGGFMADGTNCASTRLMWRENGEGEAYLYVPMMEQDPSFCAKCAYPEMDSECSDVPHCSLNRGSWSFNEGKWTTVKQYVKLNTVGKNDGIFSLWINGNLVMKEQLVYRTTNDMQLSGQFFSTFFGGSSQKYAPNTDQTILFKGFKLTAGEA